MPSPDDVDEPVETPAPTAPVDITPADSCVPIWLDTTPLEPLESPGPSPDEAAALQQERITSAIAKLVALGLTEDEARALTGLATNQESL